jgi:23S rRNA (uracil1939-C5)-methyltransferase
VVDRPSPPTASAHEHGAVAEGIPAGAELVLRAERLVAGGVALGRRDDGRVVLIDGALPGELVRVAPPVARRGAERATVLEVLEGSPDRCRPHCRHVADGCGGCDLPELGDAALLDAKVGIVADALRRLGHVTDPVVELGPALPTLGFRTSLRLAVVDGRAGLRALRSHDVVAVPTCEIAHPALAELVADGRFGDAHEVTLRVGAATGERLALIAPTVGDVHLPDDVLVVGADELAAGRRAWIHEEVAGRRWRISAESFFQTRPDGAAALVEAVRGAVHADGGVTHSTGRGVTVLDAYCGVGLFAGALLDGREGWRGVAVERSRSSVADARRNLADLPVRVVRSPVERFGAPRADVVVADPARSGLGRAGVASLVASRAARIVLVSCDAAAAGRDTALLVAEGFLPLRSTVVDLFPHTHHVEVVTSFVDQRRS